MSRLWPPHPSPTSPTTGWSLISGKGTLSLTRLLVLNNDMQDRRLPQKHYTHTPRLHGILCGHSHNPVNRGLKSHMACGTTYEIE